VSEGHRIPPTSPTHVLLDVVVAYPCVRGSSLWILLERVDEGWMAHIYDEDTDGPPDVQR